MANDDTTTGGCRPGAALPGISFLVNVQPVCPPRPARRCTGDTEESSEPSLGDPLKFARAMGDLLGSFLRPGR